jgi:metal-dependent hydrolase (beta-lactamase superfamily II)
MGSVWTQHAPEAVSAVIGGLTGYSPAGRQPSAVVDSTEIAHVVTCHATACRVTASTVQFGICRIVR